MGTRLAGRTAFVSGAASGIGRAIAQHFIAEGARVAAADIDTEALSALAGQSGMAGIACDVTSEASVRAALEAAEHQVGPIDIAVTSAGVTLGRHFLDLTAGEFDRLLAVNLRGTFLVCSHAARRMAQRGRGALVTIASVTGLRATSGRAAYAASKGGVIMLTRSMAVDLAASGIRANCIAPGAIDTPLAAAHHTGPAAAIRERWNAQTPLARYGRAEEVAAAAAFLASDDAGFVTGAVLAVDGGFLVAGMVFDLPHAGAGGGA